MGGELMEALGGLVMFGLLALGVAWLVVPVWIYRIKSDLARHLEQQGHLIRTLERLERKAQGAPHPPA